MRFCPGSIIGIAALLVFMHVPSLHAQSAAVTEARELMSWLPDADYISEGFWYLDFDPSALAYPLFEQMVLKNPMIDRAVPWPKGFTRRASAVAIAIMFAPREVDRAYVDKLQADRASGKTGGSPVTPLHVEFIDTGGITRTFDIEMNGPQLAIVRVENAESLVQAALAAGGLAETDEQLGEGPVYTYIAGDGSTGFAAREADNIFLFSTTREALRAMHAAGSNSGGQFWDRPENKALWDYLPNLGLMWTNRHSGYLDLQIKYAEQYNAPQEYLDHFTQRSEMMPTLNLFNIAIDDRLRQETIYHYKNEESAKKRYAQEREQYDKRREQLSQDPVFSTMTVELRGTTIVSTVTYTREYVEQMQIKRQEMEQKQPAKQPQV